MLGKGRHGHDLGARLGGDVDGLGVGGPGRVLHGPGDALLGARGGEARRLLHDAAELLELGGFAHVAEGLELGGLLHGGRGLAGDLAGELSALGAEGPRGGPRLRGALGTGQHALGAVDDALGAVDHLAGADEERADLDDAAAEGEAGAAVLDGLLVGLDEGVDQRRRVGDDVPDALEGLDGVQDDVRDALDHVADGLAAAHEHIADVAQEAAALFGLGLGCRLRVDRLIGDRGAVVQGRGLRLEGRRLLRASSRRAHRGLVDVPHDSLLCVSGVSSSGATGIIAASQPRLAWISRGPA
ncbi:hypothetical protein D3C86_1336020 [compost metagenome]